MTEAVQRLEIEEAPVKPRGKTVPFPPLPPRPAPVQMPETTTPKTDDATRARAEMIARVMIQALSLRALMLLVLVGAFVLARQVMADQSYLSLGALGVYCALGILPIAYLEIRRSQP